VSETESSPPASPAAPAKKGGGCLTAIIFGIIAIILIGAGSNAALGHYMENCEPGEDILDCMFAIADEEEPEGAVTATGVYTYKDYSATLTLTIPLEGGAVTGRISGTCDGVVTKASFDGKDYGVITGSMRGTCDPFFVKIPATGSFSGTVNKSAKTVPLRILGSGGGVEKSDSMSLTY